MYIANDHGVIMIPQFSKLFIKCHVKSVETLNEIFDFANLCPIFPPRFASFHKGEALIL
jgi:hypothetical protein